MSEEVSAPDDKYMAYVWHQIGASILPNVGGWLGSVAVAKNYDVWYNQLKKPSWAPPKWVYAPAWTGLYTGMGYASFLVWRDGGGFKGDAALPLTLYASQLALNWAWTPIFFGCHAIKWGLVEIVVLTGVAAATALSFTKINPNAGLLMAPYVAWLSFASALNCSIYLNNKPTKEIEEKKPEKK